MTKSRQSYFESRLTALREFYVRLWCLQMEKLIQTQSAFFFLGVKGNLNHLSQFFIVVSDSGSLILCT